jgi:hypothetical protein
MDKADREQGQGVRVTDDERRGVNAVLAECGLVALEDCPECGPWGVVHRSLTGSADARVGPRRGRRGRDVELELDHLLADRSERP